MDVAMHDGNAVRSCGCESSCPGASGGGRSCPPGDTGSADGRPAATAVAVSGLTVSACVLCCAVPLAWPALTVGIASGLYAWFERSQRPLTALSLLVVLSAWMYLVVKRRKRGMKMGSGNLAMMTAATAMTVVAMFWGSIEPVLIDAIGAG